MKITFRARSLTLSLTIATLFIGSVVWSGDAFARRLSASRVWREANAATSRRDAVRFHVAGMANAWGTGVVVSRSRSGREGLVLTVNHNIPKGADTYVSIGQQKARVTRVVAANDGMDYALVRVRLPRRGVLRTLGGMIGRTLGLGGRGLPTPAKLGALPLGKQSRVYMAGHPTADATDSRGNVRFGAETSGRIAPISVEGNGGKVRQVRSFTMSYSSGEGFSGAPVYSSKNDRMVGIHHANAFDGNGKEISFAMPTRLILKDLAGRLGKGQIARGDQRDVRALLGGIGIKK